ncbi:MAG: hypothetical protein ACE5IO_04955 [Thermoplasmata archaeon]
MDEGAKNITLAVSISLLLSFGFLGFGNEAGHQDVHEELDNSRMIDDVAIDWWFDPVSKAVCWDGRSFLQYEFRIDLNGDLGTSITSEYVGHPAPYMVLPISVVYVNAHSVGGLNGYASLISEYEVNPPIPHFRDRYGPNGSFSEWYHVFVTELEPPTNYVLGVQRSDGSSIIPLWDPFWYTEDNAMTWHKFDPSVDSKGNRTCREDFPDEIFVTHLDIDPDTLNLKSKGRWITAYLSADNASVHDTDVSSILLQDALAPERWDYQDDVLMLKFNRQEFKDTVAVGESVEVKITGKLEDGSEFEAYDYIRVISPGKR